MTLLLRKMAAQDRIEGRSQEVWGDDDFAVVDDQRIGRIYRVKGGPQNGMWSWFLHIQSGDMSQVTLTGTEPSLDRAKGAIKAEYERWKAAR